MNQIKHDGEYLHDHSAHGELYCVSEINEIVAYTVLAKSTRVRRNEKFDPDHRLWANKGFVICEQVGDRVIILYNQDGKYQLWLGAASYFIKKYFGPKEAA